MRWSIRRSMTTGLFEPTHVGSGGAMSYEEAKRMSDDLNQKIKSGVIPPNRPRQYNLGELLEKSASPEGSATN